MARSTIALKYLGSTDFPLDVMIRYPRTFIRHVFHAGDAAFDVTNVASPGELNSNSVLADLLNPLRAGGALFSIVETPGQDDIQPAISGKDRTFGIGVARVMRVVLTASGATGTADDVTIFNANAPFKMRIVDAWVVLSTSTGSSTATLWSAAGATGTQYSEPIATGTNGLSRMAGTTMTATGTVLANGSLFLHRSDRAIVGELFVEVVPEE